MTAHDDLDRILENAVGAAHRALQRLDDADVPAGLRKVRAASRKRSLPSPLRRALLEHLEEPWLRELALVELVDGDEAGRVFLARPEGWEERLKELADARQVAQRSREEAESAAELSRMRTVNAELGERLEAASGQIAELERRFADDGRVEAIRHRLKEAERTVRQLQSDLDEANQREAELEAAVVEADDKIGALRARLSRPTNEPDDRPRIGHVFGRGDPIETARLLDELVETLRPFHDRPEPEMSRPALQLPAGIRPDLPEAIDWLLHIDRRIVLVVDGHNVAHDISVPNRVTRDRIVWSVARIQRLAESPVTAVVFFDTPEGAESYRNARVSVRYVPEADDAIVDLVSRTDNECVVITTDKELRERVADHGAITLWGTAFSSWILRH